MIILKWTTRCLYQSIKISGLVYRYHSVVSALYSEVINTTMACYTDTCIVIIVPTTIIELRNHCNIFHLIEEFFFRV